ncbi:hypothetical protein Glove_194g61 [Diversispora epigaea]|uniref:Uncharacterized protein n=1 Tax=Diversispora epigaea TaxID=1348612 RepID=A0A397ISI3_9GLOM|nr:hypothetical protein Glove_194g61 [Diversispora epigaea]
MATGKQPFSDRAHDTRLIIDICNGIKSKFPDIMLDWIPQCYSDLMYKYCDEDNNFQQFKIADEKLEKAIKSQKYKSSLSSSVYHPQSCYVIHT